MIIRKVFVLALLAIVFPGIVFSAESSNEKEELIDELMRLNGSDQIGKQYGRVVLNQLRENLSIEGIELEPHYFEIIADTANEVITEIFFDSKEFKRLRYQLWSEKFEADELRALVEFFASPLGKKFIEQTPKFAIEFENEGIAKQEELMFNLESRLYENLEEAGLATDKIWGGGYNGGTVSHGPTEEELAALRTKFCDSADTVDKRVPVYRGPPDYPFVAQSFGVEGWVELVFSVLDDGSTENIRIYNASTGILFNDAAKEAVRKYVYCPGGKTENEMIRIRFEMEK